LRFIRDRTGTAHAARQEIERFGAFLDFIREVPEFLRILNEAEFFAPAGYQKHLDNISTAYVRILRRARHAGAIDDFSDEEFEAIVHMFNGRARLPQPPLFVHRRRRHRGAGSCDLGLREAD